MRRKKRDEKEREVRQRRQREDGLPDSTVSYVSLKFLGRLFKR